MRGMSELGSEVKRGKRKKKPLLDPPLFNSCLVDGWKLTNASTLPLFASAGVASINPWTDRPTPPQPKSVVIITRIAVPVPQLEWTGS
jgi:hypothetical protein